MLVWLGSVSVMQTSILKFHKTPNSRSIDDLQILNLLTTVNSWWGIKWTPATLIGTAIITFLATRYHQMHRLAASRTLGRQAYAWKYNWHDNDCDLLDSTVLLLVFNGNFHSITHHYLDIEGIISHKNYILVIYPSGALSIVFDGWFWNFDPQFLYGFL
jgi:hypothetical protein